MARPRFVNPHFLADSSTLVTRKRISTEEDGNEQFFGSGAADPDIVDYLNKLIDIEWAPTTGMVEKRRRKTLVATPLSVLELGKPIRMFFFYVFLRLDPIYTISSVSTCLRFVTSTSNLATTQATSSVKVSLLLEYYYI